jgi:hypothetical protein
MVLLPIDTLGVLDHHTLADAGNAVTLTARASPARISERDMRRRGCMARRLVLDTPARPAAGRIVLNMYVILVVKKAFT